MRFTTKTIYKRFLVSSGVFYLGEGWKFRVQNQESMAWDLGCMVYCHLGFAFRVRGWDENSIPKT